ncbi:MAG TPA: Gfo/Idh/MocA family oxidoreductase [Acidimicrobiales bacterium]|nr:Gfo/Idh/MocA family oxidoreductase [Acidimicrobiales bacterium]
MRVALVGYGLAGRWFHRPLIAATAGLELTTVVTGDPERQAQARLDVPGARVLDAPDRLWALADEHELAVIATPTASHVALASRAIAEGLPVVVEKPLAPGASEAQALVEAATAAGLALIPFHNRRWDSDHLTLRSLLARGALGDVMRYESRFERWRPDARPESWRETLPPQEGGGVLSDLGIHLVDQARDLFGPVRALYAEVEARRGGADDDVFLALEHRSGVRSHLWAGALSAAPGPRLRVLGSRAAYVHPGLDGQEAALRAGAGPADPGFGEEPPARWGRLHHGDEAGEVVPGERGRWSDFYPGVLAAVRDGHAPPVRAQEAVAALAVLDAARRSAAEVTVVTPDDP